MTRSGPTWRRAQCLHGRLTQSSVTVAVFYPLSKTWTPRKVTKPIEHLRSRVLDGAKANGSPAVAD